MATEVKVIEDSISQSQKRIVTLQIKFHRFILPEFNTHRVFSRNFSSSRAIPTKKLLEQVINDPAYPVEWGKNQPGMQAKELLPPIHAEAARVTWQNAAKAAADYAEQLSLHGAHKQIVNRVIEPFLWATGIVTATEWANWFDLRDHEDAQPEIRHLARLMKEAIDKSTPRVLERNQWHLPYVLQDERNDSYFAKADDKWLLMKISAARCCRVSYLKHDGQAPSIKDDIALFDRLAGAVPIHASPLEHQATPDAVTPYLFPHLHGNFRGWIQFRHLWENRV